MKRHKYTLTIDTPCGQDWTSMANVDNGRFCSQCSKSVIDFTKLTDKQIIQIIEQESDKICGRLTNKQINRLLVTNQPTKKLKIFEIFASLLVVFTTENSFAINQNPSQIEYVSVIDNNDNPHIQEYKEMASDSLKNLVKGKVIDANTKDPLPIASIIIKGTKTGVAAGPDGKFNLVIPDSLLTDKIILVAMCIGYERAEITINRKDLPIKNDILVIPTEPAFLGEVCIIKKKQWWQFWKKK